jgi:hypothetical protein
MIILPDQGVLATIADALRQRKRSILGYIRRPAKPGAATGSRRWSPDIPARGPMPELPEVETTRRGIAPLVVGRRVALLKVYDHRLRWPVPAALPKLVAGRMIDAVDRRS